MLSVKLYEKYKIVWMDHCSECDGGWHPIAKAEARLVVCETTGYCIAVSKDAITLAGTLHKNKNGVPVEFSGDQTIGKALIVDVKALK